jgi:hypothetical protein
VGRQAYEKRLLSAMDELLRPAGFRKKGALFVAERGELFHVVHLYKDQSIDPEEYSATIYTGVCYPALGRACAERDPKQAIVYLVDRPKCIEDCHWNRSWPPAERSFSVRSPEEAETMADDITRYLQESGLPELERLTSTAELREALYRGGNTGGSATNYVCRRIVWEWATAEGKPAYYGNEVLTEAFFLEWARPQAAE